MGRESVQRAILGLPLLRSLRVRRWVWDRRNDLWRMRRGVFERLGSDRYSHPALHDLDRKLTGWLPAEGGFFVEAGAYDGFLQSNTYWLERFRGWRGVLVEPVPHLFRRAARQRRRAQVFNCALVPADHPEREVTMRYGGLMSLVKGALGGADSEDEHVRAGDMLGLDDVAYEISVTARTLTSVLEEAEAPQQIDLLSLDVEGFEASVLRGLDLDRFKPTFIVVEVDDQNGRRQAVEEVLGERYEFLERLSPADLLYRLKREAMSPDDQGGPHQRYQRHAHRGPRPTTCPAGAPGQCASSGPRARRELPPRTATGGRTPGLPP